MKFLGRLHYTVDCVKSHPIDDVTNSFIKVNNEIEPLSRRIKMYTDIDRLAK